ncbi:hypothetical protein GCM10009127_04270 [Alteraurantiacibacter aestuarii]
MPTTASTALAVKLAVAEKQMARAPLKAGAGNPAAMLCRSGTWMAIARTRDREMAAQVTPRLATPRPVCAAQVYTSDTV